MAKCPNKSHQTWKNMEEAFGYTKAMMFYVLNNENLLDQAPNGEESKLYKDLVSLHEGNEIEALKAKIKTYSKEFKNWFGDWLNPTIFTALNVDNVEELKSKYSSKLPNKFYHHSTIKFGSQKFNNNENKKEKIKIIGRLTTDKVDVLIVDNKYSNNKYPHITLATAEGIKPFESNKEIENNLDKIQKLNDFVEVTFKNNLKNDISKVVDENGEPLIVYHGSKISNKITKFNRDVTYTTTDKNYATTNFGFKDSNNVYALFLNIKNPLNADKEGKNIMDAPEELIDTYIAPRVIKKWMGKHYDGVYGTDSYGDATDSTNGKVYVAFNPNQIKSIYNAGEFGKNNDNIYYAKQNQVNYNLKAVDILQSNRAEQIFSKGEKNNWSLNKILTELGISKEQKQIILDKNLTDREEIIISLLAENSFVVEVNTSKEKKETEYTYIKEENNKFNVYNVANDFIESFSTKKQAEDVIKDFNHLPTQHYSNLTVPGGKNYTENEIAVPGITPNIKGHAQFSTDNGIGWFRSDDAVINAIIGFVKDDSVKKKLLKLWGNNIKYIKILKFHKIEVYRDNTSSYILNDLTTGKFYYLHPDDYEPLLDTSPTIDNFAVKTIGGELINVRRILEIQSDLFQKGRDKKDLTKTKGVNIDTNTANDFNLDGNNYRYSPITMQDTGETTHLYLKNNKKSNKEEYENARKELESRDNKDITQNQFLQLLNKKGNWIKFFIQSIIQDSVKKGYEKVLFPTGETAAKIEGHQVIADRIKGINNKINFLTDALNSTGNSFLNNGVYTVLDIQATNKQALFDRIKNEITDAKKQKQELKTQGLEKLAPIEAFYENRIQNILNKTYGKDNIKNYTDEHGNKWLELNLTDEKIKSKVKEILLAKTRKANLSVNKVNPIKGLNNISETVSIEDFIKENKLDKIESDLKQRGDKTYSLLFNKAKEYNITIKGELQDLSDSQSVEEVENLAAYDRTTNQILLDRKIENITPLSQTRILGHEIIHGILENEYNAKSTMQKAQVRRDFNAFIASLKPYADSNPNIKRVLDNIDESDWQEVVTYGLTDTAFAAELNNIVLNNIDYGEPNKTFWSRLKELILSIISDDFTKLEELVNILDYHFDLVAKDKMMKSLTKENVIKQRDLYNKYKYAKNAEVAGPSVYSEAAIEQEKIVLNKLEDKLLSFLDDVGISFESVDTITDRNGQPISALGKADLINKVIQVVKSNKDITTLPEEAAHVFVKLLGDSPLYKEMMRNIHKFQIYKDTVAKYGEVYNYNETKLKEEAIGKLIAHAIINEETIDDKKTFGDYFQRWWNKVWNYVTKLLDGSNNAEELDPYVRAAKMIVNNETKDLLLVDDLSESEYELVYYDLTAEEKAKRTSLEEIFNNPAIELEPISHTYRVKEDGRLVKKTASDSVKEFYYKMFKKVGFTDKDAMFFADKGTYIHGLLENIVNYAKDNPSSVKNKNTVVAEVMTSLQKLPDFNKYDTSFFVLTDNQYEELYNGAVTLINQINKNNDKINKSVGVNTRANIYTELAIYDPLADEAGTLDLAVLYSNGSVGLYDYKSMVFKHFDTFTAEVAHYKREAFDVQMNRYKRILENGARVTNFAESRIIPINIQLKKNAAGEYTKAGFSKIEMGNTKDRDYLEQIPVAGEKTDNIALNDAIKKMESLRDSIYNKLNKDYNNTRLKERLININKSIDKLILDKDVNYVLDELRAIYKEFDTRKRTTFNSPDKMDMEELGDLLGYLEYFEIYIDFASNARGLLTKDDKKLQEKITQLPNFLVNLKQDVHNTILDYVRHYYNVDIKGSVKDVALLGKQFKQLSEFEGSAFKLLNRIVNENANKTRNDVNKLIEELTVQRNNVKEWASNNGMNLYEAYELLINDETGALIGKYRPEYYESYEEAIKNKNFKWIRDNMEDYDKSVKTMQKDKAIYKKALEKEILGKDRDRRIGGKMKQWIESYDFVSNGRAYFNKYNNYINLKDNPAYYSERFSYVYKNKPLLNYYDTYVKFNEEFREITDKKIKRNFIAEMKKNMIDAVTQTGMGFAMKNIGHILLDSFEIEEFDPSSVEKDWRGQPIRSIPLRYKKLITGKVSKEKVESIENALVEEGYKKGTSDFRLMREAKINSAKIREGRKFKSVDLTESMIQFSKSAYSYRYLSETETLAKALQVIMKSDKVDTELLDSSGDNLMNKLKSTVIKKAGLDAGMVEVFDNFVSMYWYGGVTKNEIGTFTMGAKYDENGKIISEGKTVSVNKMVEAFMSFTSLKSLALNPFLSAGNALGIFANAYMLGSEEIYFTKSQLNIGFKNLTSRNKLTLAATKFFEVAARDLVTEKANKLKGSWFDRNITMDNMYIGFKIADDALDVALLDAMMQNFGIQKVGEDYELVRLNKKVNQGKGVKSLKELSRYDEAKSKFTFEGLDMKDPKIQDVLAQFRAVVQKRSTFIKGSIPEADKYQATQSMTGRALMQFRGWIPGLFKTRFNKFAYDEDINEADTGRFNVTFQEVWHSKGFLDVVRTFMRMVGEILVSAPGIRQATGNYSFFKNNHNTEATKRLYAEYLNAKKLNPDKFTIQDYQELRVAKLRGMANELGMYFTFFALAALAKAAIPDDKDDPTRTVAKNIYRIMRRGLLETSFWLDPSSFTSWLDKPFVMMRTVANIAKLLKNTADVARDMFLEDSDPYKAILKKASHDKTPMLYYTNQFIFPVDRVLDFVDFWEKPVK